MARTIKQSIDIDAPTQRVYNVLVQDELTSQWYATFGEGTRAHTDWKEGSPVLFTDESNSGLAARIVVNRPSEEIKLEYTGIVQDGKIDEESPFAQSLKGGIEHYLLKTENGKTKLDISCDMSEDQYESMNNLWIKALDKVKQLAEVE